MAKDITLELLLDRKRQSQDDKLKKVLFYSKVLDGNIEIIKQKAKDILKLMDKLDTSDVEESYRANCKLIFTHCPIFKSKELQDEYGAVEPYDVISAVFEENLGEINKLCSAILNLYGLGDNVVAKEVNEIKN